MQWHYQYRRGKVSLKNRCRWSETFDDVHFVEKLNLKFAIEAASKQNYHVALQKGQDLRPIFCFETMRNVSHDWVVQNNNRFYQILKDSKLLPRPNSKVTVCEWLDGSIHILFKDKELFFEEITLRQKRSSRRVS